MSLNFDFLRNFNNDLHYLAGIIEDEIYDSPSAVLTDATTFLEIIIYNIFKENELDMDDLVYFKDKVIFLSQAGFLSPELKKHMLKAYSIRNKMHSYNGDAKNHIHLNQLRAVHIHRLLFNVSWLYYIENSPERFKAEKPNYTHPSKLKNTVLVKSELGNGKCIICESKTSSEDEIFCRECKYKIEKSDNLKTLRKHFGFKNGFKRKELIEIGFEKGYIGSFIQELKNDDLIYSVGKVNYIDRENAGRYIEESESIIGIEKLISDFKLKHLSLKDILNHEYYQKGQAGKYPFVGFYHLFNEILYHEFITQINSKTSIEETLNQSYLTIDELNDWYFNDDGPEHEVFNEKLIDEIFYYKKRGSDVNFIMSEDILNEIRKSDEYIKKEDELKFTLFLQNTLRIKSTKKEALDDSGLTEKDLEGLFIKYPDFEGKFENSYTKRKMEKFLKYYEHYNYKNSLKKNRLIQEEIDAWLENARTEENELYLDFLDKFNRITVEKYIEYRKKGNTKHKSLKKINCDEETMEHLLQKYGNDLDEYFVNESIELLKTGKTKDKIIRQLDVTSEWFATSIEKGMEGKKPYADLYQEYSKNAIPRQTEKFLELIKDRPLKNVLKELDMDEKELDNWCAQGKDSISPYESFYQEFLKYKKEAYVKTMIKTDSKQKAMKKSYLTKEELSEIEDELNQQISDKRMEIVINELEKGSTTKKASQKASIKITTLYDWLNRAIDGDEYYADYLESYTKEYLIPIRHAYAEGVKRGASEKEIIRTLKRNDFLVNEDVKQLKMLDLFPKPGDTVIELDEDLEIDLN